MNALDIIEKINELEIKILCLKKDVSKSFESSSYEEEFNELCGRIAVVRQELIEEVR